ncbi:MAG TPA: SDR family oxidoreductase, partial [Conexibacter sp.]
MDWNVGAGLGDKGVIVTGAAGGIGAEVVRAFAAAGARVAAVDVDAASVREVVGALDGAERHLALAADLRDVGAHPRLVETVRDALGSVDVLAHVAAVLRRRSDIDEISEDDWDFQHDVNLRATFFLNKAVARAMRDAGRGGRIINFTSQGWLTGGFGGSVAYAATKGGIVSLSRGLARTLAPHGITVNTVAPGAVDTPMMWSGMTEADMAEFVKQIP